MVGLVIPALPGTLLVFAGLFLAAWVEDFNYVGAVTLSVLGVLALLSYGADFIAGAFGVKKYGASTRAVIGATLGAIVGIFFGILGIILGPFIGAVAGELSNRAGVQAAARAGFGATVGLVLGIAAKLALAFIMVGTFIFMRLAGAA
jgi:uncharacterized protein YqgC (DUF456 family)